MEKSVFLFSNTSYMKFCIEESASNISKVTKTFSPQTEREIVSLILP